MHQTKADYAYDYISCHTDDWLIVMVNAQENLNSVMKVYEVGNLGPPFTILNMITGKSLMMGKNSDELAAPHLLRKHL